MHGSVEDTPDGGAAYATVPTDLVVKSPPVKAVGLQVSCLFKADSMGVLRCSGHSGSKDVVIGAMDGMPGMSAGAAEGTASGRILPDKDVPKDLPQPPAQ